MKKQKPNYPYKKLVIALNFQMSDLDEEERLNKEEKTQLFKNWCLISLKKSMDKFKRDNVIESEGKKSYKEKILY